LRVLVEGGRFIVNSSDKNLTVSFSMRSGEPICDVAMLVLVVGDLKFYAQTLGRDNMSSHWCMWCKEHPNTWDHLNDVAVIKAIERLDKWHVIGNVDLAMQCYSKPELLKALRA